jgi:hypothetical protein
VLRCLSILKLFAFLFIVWRFLSGNSLFVVAAGLCRFFGRDKATNVMKSLHLYKYEVTLVGRRYPAQNTMSDIQLVRGLSFGLFQFAIVTCKMLTRDLVPISRSNPPASTGFSSQRYSLVYHDAFSTDIGRQSCGSSKRPSLNLYSLGKY